MAEPLALIRPIPKLELEKWKLMLQSLPENSLKRWCPLDPEERTRNRQGKTTFLSAGQLVFRPGAGLLTLLGLVSVCPVEPAGWGDGGLRPLIVVRGSWGAGTAGGCGIGCKRVAVLVGPEGKTGGLGSPVRRLFREEAWWLWNN